MNIIEGKVTPIHDDVLVCEMEFGETTTTYGLVIPNDDGKDHGIKPRWAKVYDIGPEQKWIKKDEWILVEHGRWTRGVTINDCGLKVIRKVDFKSILATADEKPVEM